MGAANIIPPNQFGFMPDRSTDDALSALGSKIGANLNNQMPTALVSLDLNKAFDSICPLLHTEKLERLGLDSHSIRCIYHFLSIIPIIMSLCTSWGTSRINFCAAAVFAVHR